MTNAYYVIAFHHIDKFKLKRTIKYNSQSNLAKYTKYLALSFSKHFVSYREAYRWQHSANRKWGHGSSVFFHLVNHKNKLFQHTKSLIDTNKLLNFTNIDEYLITGAELTLKQINGVCRYWQSSNNNIVRDFLSIMGESDTNKMKAINERRLDDDIPKKPVYQPKKPPFVPLKTKKSRADKNEKRTDNTLLGSSVVSHKSGHHNHKENPPKYPQSSADSKTRLARRAMVSQKPASLSSTKLAASSRTNKTHHKASSAIDNNKTLTKITNKLNYEANEIFNSLSLALHIIHHASRDTSNYASKTAHRFNLLFIARDVTKFADKFSKDSKRFVKELWHLVKDVFHNRLLN